MRILSCFLRPPGERPVLAGCSIADDTRAARRALGYLPEAVPLPPEMRVTEYLGYRAALKAIRAASGAPRSTTRSAIAGLADGAARSSGRCRAATGSAVGLADALLARPRRS
jgi:ABC-2 type transport system ATP-binding protein